MTVTTEASISYKDKDDVTHQHTKTIPYPQGIYDLVDMIVDLAAGSLIELLKELDTIVTDITLVYFNSKGKLVQYTQSVPYPDGAYQIQQELYMMAVPKEV